MILINELNGDILLKGKFILDGSIASSKTEISGNVINGGARSLPAYEGSYSVTPSDTQQILLTNDMRMTANIVIEKIPGTLENNWGRITWNGSTITVS